MWTSKRVLMLLAGFALFVVVYQLYANVLGLGGIDGLTPLPEGFWPPTGQVEASAPVTKRRQNFAKLKLRQAFGDGSPELDRLIMLDMPGRGLVIAVNDIKIMPAPQNDWVELAPFSIAIMKATVDGPVAEINSVRCNKAYLRLDQPIKSQAELSKCKIIGGELRDDVRLVNNRGTIQATDDLEMFTHGRVHYEEARRMIWTSDPVKLIDHQAKPEPTTISANRMDVYLAATNEGASSSQAGQKANRQKQPDVDRVELSSNVRMDHWVEGGAGFLTSGKPVAKPASGGSAPPPERAKLIITTDGKFSYDLVSNRATFDIPHKPSRTPEIVRVVREVENAKGKRDQLECDLLNLDFRRKSEEAGKTSTPKSATNRTTPNLEIVTAQATGKSVVLTSDAEALSVHGTELTYDAAKKTTIIKGNPRTIALKEGNEINAREFWLVTGDRPDGAHATAMGPGEVTMLDKSGEKSSARSIKAQWKEKLDYHKEGTFDCLILTGDASFEDPGVNQRMRADRLKVWLSPRSGDTKDSDGSRQVRPHHLEAKGHVFAESDDLRIKEPTDYLVIWFQDLPAKVDLFPPVTDDAHAINSETPPAATESRGTRAAAEPTKKKKPLSLSARSVEVHVLRSSNKHELERLWCEGSVHVHQDADNADDKGTDIRGDTLQLNHSPDGGVLIVSSKTTDGSLARVQFNKLTILGPEVNIDQRANRATVNGEGAMQMMSDTNFDGVRLPKPTEMTVNWKERMDFDGLGADFSGGVQATQEQSRLLCVSMRVTFDRPVSFKGGNKGGPSPKVDKLLCDKEVFIEEETHQGAKLIGYRRLAAPEVNLDNANKSADIPGPGVVRLYQLASANDAQLKPSVVAPNAKPAAAAGSPNTPRPEFTITHVTFRDHMQAKQRESRTVTFWGDVHAVHVPADKPDLEIDLDKLPPGCMYIHGNILRVLSHRHPNGRTTQEMVAEGKVSVKANEFWALAETVKFDEVQDRIIFEGGSGGEAKVYQTKDRGAKPTEFSAKKITYWRKTGEIRIEGGSGLRSQ